jgi:pimeloyl-ACP methyl ester carboxylesterase
MAAETNPAENSGMPFLRRQGDPTAEQSEDIELYYEVRGSGGPRLLMFNGSGSTIALAAPLIDALARSCEVLVHDQRCLGRSSVPQRQPTMADYAADAVALLDHVGWESCCVFGISFGGMVAQEFAVTWPERVERLALFCTSPGGAGGSSYPLHELAGLAPAERAAISIVNLDTRFSAAWFETHPADRAIFEMMAERAAATRTEEQRRGEAMQLEARRHHDVWDRLGRITAPTFIGCGRYDGVAPPANSHAIHSRVPHAELHEYEGGHLFAMQDPRALRDATTFLTT